MMAGGRHTRRVVGPVQVSPGQHMYHASASSFYALDRCSATITSAQATHASPKSLSLICPFGSNRKFCQIRPCQYEGSMDDQAPDIGLNVSVNKTLLMTLLDRKNHLKIVPNRSRSIPSTSGRKGAVPQQGRIEQSPRRKCPGR
jgi:hypothetical protein